MANSQFQQAAERAPKPPKKPSRFLKVLSLILRGRFADATEYDIDGDTEN